MKHLLLVLVTFSLIGLSTTEAADRVLINKLVADMCAESNDQLDSGIKRLFVHEGAHYEVYYNWLSSPTGLALTFRLPGLRILTRASKSGDVLGQVIDKDLDGVVDVGADGDGRTRLFITAGYVNAGFSAQGSVYQSHWQKIYDKAILALKADLALHRESR